MNLRSQALLGILLVVCPCVAAFQQPASPVSPANPPASSVIFSDVSSEAGIRFVHNSAPEKKYIVESMSGGVALLDYDNDGWLDVFFVNACTVDTASDPKCSRSALYHNERNGKFTDVAEPAGVAYVGWGQGVCVADVDADGFDDLYVTVLGDNRFYRNSG
ncbi:MAG: FG-GAP repeat domain-containing protein, partial [Terriglobales bacterium]